LANTSPVTVCFDRRYDGLLNPVWLAVAEVPPFMPDGEWLRVPSSVASGPYIDITVRHLPQFVCDSYRLILTCLVCGHTSSREYSVDEETGVCEFCSMDEEDRRRRIAQQIREEDYVYGPPDVDYPPDTLPVG
jgi:hypothetical protein